MRFLRIVVMCFLLAPLVSVHAGDAEEKAEAAALAWLALVDSEQWAESWSQASTLFQGQVGQQQWAQTVRSVRGPLGGLKSRKLKSAEHMTSLPGAPDGDYVVIQFDTVFENKASAVETVTPMLDGEEWRVSGYFIR